MDQEKTREQLYDEIKALQENLDKCKQFQHSIIDTAIDAIVTITEEGLITSWNHSAQDLFGYEEHEILNKSILEIIPDRYQQFKDIDRLMALWLQNKTGRTTELVAIKKDGTEFPVELSVAKWDYKDNTNITGIIRDISERKKSYFELQKLQMALKKTNEVVFMTDTKGVFTFVNEKFTKVYGFEPFEVIEKQTPRILKSPKTKTDYAWFWQQLLDKKPLRSNQYTNKTKFGEIIDVEGSAEPILDKNGELLGFLGIQRDIRQRIKDLDNLKELLFKAQESDKLKSEFLANVSHELRTPLNSIIGLSSLIDKDTPFEDVLEYNEIIKTSGEDLLSIVENLIDISMIESKQLKAHKKSVKLETLLQELDSSMRVEQAKLNKDHLAFNLMMPPEYKNLTIFTDKMKLLKILKCLIKNAFTFTDNGFVNYGFNIYLSQDNKPIIKFFVEDTGIGIHENDTEVIFEFFRQIDGSLSRRHEGMGVGLSIARRLTKLLGGSIWVDSVLAKGSTFFFTIPIELENKTINPLNGSNKVGYKTVDGMSLHGSDSKKSREEKKN